MERHMALAMRIKMGAVGKIAAKTLAARAAAGLAASLALLVAVWPAGAGHKPQHHARPALVHAAPQQQIACTVLGCMPIPAACHPREEHSFGGIPTGYDQIVCPPAFGR